MAPEASTLAHSLELLSKYDTCNVSDALIKLKHPTGGLLPDMTLHVPLQDKVKLVGLAHTVRLSFADEDQVVKLQGPHWVDQLHTSVLALEPVCARVIVVQAPPGAQNAVWGGLMTARAQNKDVFKGVVIDGRFRDVGEQEEAGFVIFAKGRSTLGQSPFLVPTDLGCPLAMTGSVESVESTLTRAFNTTPTVVNQGDIIMGDVNGVVCIPNNLITRVLEQCAHVTDIDDRCMHDIKAGRDLTATFKEHRQGIKP